MKIVAFDAVSAVQWNDVCDRSEDAWLFHRHEWVEIEAEHFAMKNLSFAIADGRGTLIGVQPLYLRENGLGTWSEQTIDCGVHRHTGLALIPEFAGPEVRAARRLAMNHLDELAAAERVDRIHLNCQNLAPRNLSGRREEIPFWVMEDGYHLGLHFGPNGFLPVPGMATCCADQIVPLAGRSEEDLFAALDEACRRAVRKAQRSGLTIVVAAEPEAVEAYYQIALSSSKRTGETLPDSSYYSAIHRTFAGGGRSRFLFARQAGRPMGGLLLLIDKGAVSFAAGASVPEGLPLRVNDFLHWSAIAFARAQGYAHYRLGPVFPELPPDWPIARVSRFKKKFGGANVSIIQGSRFRRPARYVSAAPGEVARLSGRGFNGVATAAVDEGLGHVLRCYGVPTVQGMPTVSLNGRHETCPVLVITDGSAAERLGLKAKPEPPGAWCYARPRWSIFGKDRPAYRALLPHVSFSGDGLEPVWVSDEGRPVVAWHGEPGDRRLVVGLDVENEIVRYWQGDPERADAPGSKARFGFDTERANYLFDDHVTPRLATHPWADYLGFLVAEGWSRLSGLPLVEPLPNGAKGAVILTGDDDQAWLETYAEQRRVLGDLAFTYLLHPLTRHTPETLASLGPTAEFGLHPDALDRPDDYEALCREQALWIEKLCGRKVRVVRNHSYLSRGYLGHVRAWEDNGLELDVNYSAADGTAMTGSFLPMRVRRADGSWSEHLSLLTAFGDGMIFALGLSDREAARRVRRLARQIESSVPGVVVLNLHPQNIARTRRLHRAAVALGRRSGWVTLGLETYLEWLRARDAVVVERYGSTLVLTSDRPVRDLAIRISMGSGWRKLELKPWSGRLELTVEQTEV
jgi:hypothetical protein